MRVCLAAALLLAGCRKAPTTILLEVRAGAGLPPIEFVSLDIYNEQGVAVQGRRLPQQGVAKLPGTVVLYPPQAQGELRIRGLGMASGAVQGEGVTWVTLRPGAQVSASLTLDAGRLLDQDGDNIPDLIDNCPGMPNPDQKPCPSPDGSPDSEVEGVDATGDGRRDSRAGDLACDFDKDGYLSVICGGTDCDDGNPSVHPAPSEGSAGAATCSDGLDNDCDGLKDQADPDCIKCSSDAQCADKTMCTADTCSGQVCVHTPINEGKICNDNQCALGVTKCQNGVCTGKPKTCPPATNVCKQATCDPAIGCTTVDKPDGTACADADPCSKGETCQSGVCVTPSQPAQCYINGTCYANGNKPDNCRICDTAKSKTAWSIVAGYCYIDAQCRAAGPLTGSCLVCDPAKSATMWTAPSGCGIMLVALNEGHQGNLGGVAGADSLCQTQATGLTGTFKAFLSTSTQSAKNLVTGTAVAMPVVNSKAQVLYTSWTALFSGAGWPVGTSIYSFDGKLVDELTGANPEWSDADVWTGTLVDGSAAADNCNGWTSADALVTGAGGEIDLNHFLNLTEHNACSLYQAVVCVRLPPP